jgi:hypothetical protein
MHPPDKARRRALKRAHLTSDPVYRELHSPPSPITAERIICGPADEVEALIVSEVARRCGRTPNAELAALTSMSAPVRAIFTTSLLEAEVMNGGFDQFAFNQQPAIWSMAIEGYRELGLSAAGVVASQALDAFESGESLESFDRSFDEMWTEIKAQKQQLIRRNPDRFVIGG